MAGSLIQLPCIGLIGAVSVERGDSWEVHRRRFSHELARCQLELTPLLFAEAASFRLASIHWHTHSHYDYCEVIQ